MSLSEQYNRDWMREIEADTRQMQELVRRIDRLAADATTALVRHDHKGCGMRLAEIQEGLQLLCDLTGIKVDPHVATA
jgi:hypothetical protein